jgi:hypothetical protein
VYSTFDGEFGIDGPHRMDNLTIRDLEASAT